MTPSLPPIARPPLSQGDRAGQDVRHYNNWRETIMNMTLSIGPLVSLVAGILILVIPRLLNYIVAIYLIIMGLLGLFGGGQNFHFR